eukprot:5424469-Alexandrium_andersonii.AAC.1
MGILGRPICICVARARAHRALPGHRHTAARAFARPQSSRATAQKHTPEWGPRRTPRDPTLPTAGRPTARARRRSHRPTRSPGRSLARWSRHPRRH